MGNSSKPYIPKNIYYMSEEDKLFINILDKGDIAVRKSKPKRLLILLSSIMLGMMSSVLYLLYRNKLLFK